MTFRNPNPRIGIYYHKIDINAIYHGKQFGSNKIDGNGFYLGHKSENNNMSVVFKGEEFVALGSFEKSRYDLEKIDGVYEIELILRVHIEYMHFVVKLGKFDECRVECGLKVPLSKVSPRRFERTKCRVR
uniref:NDR1/HIN1-like protein 3 n=1 Tax=Erigeron canadensis TaxID=72917 RepID=UPI001CB93C76|nr:NDR1/HIN1-like protein 3 [Erigeron canadensis]